MYDDEEPKSSGAGTRHDKHVPNHIRALTHYFHSMTEIYEYYRGFGLEMPEVFNLEIRRAEAELKDALFEETTQGGSLREFYEALTQPEKEKLDATRKG